MVGVITGWDILTHPLVTIGCFGWGVFFKALFAGQRQTFLSLLPQTRLMEGAASEQSLLVDQCIDLELRAKRLYVTFARAFVERPEASQFFVTLAQQEQEHADLLKLCSLAARHGGWIADGYNPWINYIPRLEEHMQTIEKSLGAVGWLEDALGLVVQIESGEINRVFHAMLASCNSAFVRRLDAFRRATETHISYIAGRLPELDVRFTLAAREMRALLPHTQQQKPTSLPET